MGYNLQAGDQVQADDLEQVYRASGPYAASSAGSDAYAITVTPPPDTLEAGMVFRFKADVANTGAATLNVNSKGAKTIKKWGSGGKQDLSTGDIQASQFVTVIYDGTDMLLISAQQPRPLYSRGIATRSSGSGTGTQNIAHGLGCIPRLIKITAASKDSSLGTQMESHGSASGTGDQGCIFWANYDGADPAAPSTDTSNIINLVDRGGTTDVIAAISAIDDTNITLNFSTFTGLGGSVVIQWEAYA